MVSGGSDEEGGQGLDSRLVRAGMSRADEMLVSGVGDC